VTRSGRGPDEAPPLVDPEAAAAVPSAARPAEAPAGAIRPVASQALFRGATELQILHRGALYRLKQTALGKLILTK